MAFTTNSINSDAGVVITGETGSVEISNDAYAAIVSVGTGAAVKNVTLGSINTTSATAIQSGTTGITVTATNGPLDINSGTGALSIASDNTTNTITVGVGGAASVKTCTFGSSFNASTTKLQSGSGALDLLTGNGVFNLTTGTGAINIGNDITVTTINIGTVGFAAVKTVNVGSAANASATSIKSGTGTLDVVSLGGALTIKSDTGALAISNDAVATTVSVATGAGAKTLTMGSTTTTSATTVQSGSGALNITSTNGAITMNSGTGTVAIGNDATAATYNFATGAGAKVVTLGSTNGASSLALKFGTADFTLASATGTTFQSLDTGENTQPLQPAFMACLSANQNNVTGTAGAYININANTEVFDVNGDYNNATFTLTAPVTGKYELGVHSTIIGCTIATQIGWQIATSNRNYAGNLFRNASASNLGIDITLMADMDAADTAQFKVLSGGEAGDTDDIYGDGTVGGTWCEGYLIF